MLIAAAVGTIAAQSRAAESQSTPGVSDTHIKIGQTIAYSGPASSLATIGRTQAAITAWSTVPQTFLFTGTSRFRDPQHYPWTIGGDLSFVSETRGFAKFILTEKPDAKIAVLYQNEERFSLSGAAHEPLSEDCLAGYRAGERKTYWTKPPPPPPRLWALNGPEPIGSARLRGR
jgi:hypothetical protein